MQKNNINIDPLPLASIGRCLKDTIEAYFENPENMEKFNKWKAERDLKLEKEDKQWIN